MLTRWRASEKASIAHVEGARFHLLQDATMASILARESTDVRIAHPTADAETIAGWACLRPPAHAIHRGPGRYAGPFGPAPIVYFVYMRPEARRLGLAHRLLEDVIARSDTLYTSRPARIRDPRLGREGEIWRMTCTIPRGWTYCPRVAFHEVP